MVLHYDQSNNILHNNFLVKNQWEIGQTSKSLLKIDMQQASWEGGIRYEQKCRQQVGREGLVTNSKLAFEFLASLQYNFTQEKVPHEASIIKQMAEGHQLYPHSSTYHNLKYYNELYRHSLSKLLRLFNCCLNVVISKSL